MLRYFIILFVCLGVCAQGYANSPVKVGVLVPMQHQAMTEITKGFKQELQKSYHGKITFLVKNAQGDANLQRAILQEFIQQKVDLIAPIGTEATQMALAMIKNKPIIGIAAKYSEKQRQLRKPCNVTVVDDEISVTMQMAFMHDVMPQLKQITLVHSPGDKIMPEVQDCIKYGKQYGIQVQDLTVQQLSDLYTISSHISASSQAIFILKDSLIVSGIRTLVQQGKKRDIPVISSDDGSVQNGAVFALGVKERQIGVIGAKLAARVLQGVVICKIPIATMENPFVFINVAAAQELKLKVSFIEKMAKAHSYQVIRF
jgi:putative ABC transport system substrate-binding protein